ncbi:KHG/KDPG aldolase-like isoform X7 [Macadamia integrifolia]|uniref:KHG/KDPG aldolase-like isoform X7 n=1 Tax=Macadamia integrifolia TaxID=60698 RepID=UPI001C4FD1A5|nr:KHG/KDPG aldolase-like isoform X7 [Macadamia integrifolia]
MRTSSTVEELRYGWEYCMELAMEAAHAALRGGISVLEIVMSTPGVFEVLQELVGTVLNTIDAKNAIKAGAKFLMSPAMVKDILDDVQSKEVLYIPGVMTPTEVLNAHSAGAIIVKVYPVSSLGGAQYISALKKPFPHIPMVASQGITVESLGTYIARGASAVVLSDAIFGKEAMDQQNFDAIRQLSQLAVSRGDEAVQSTGPGQGDFQLNQGLKRLAGFDIPSVCNGEREGKDSVQGEKKDSSREEGGREEKMEKK